MTADKKKLFLPLFLGFILVASAFGVVFYGFTDTQSTTTVKYKDYTFVSAGGGYWTVRVGGNPYTFANNPTQTEGFEVVDFPFSQFNSGRKIYVSYDPNTALGGTLNEMQNFIIPYLAVQPFRACPADASGCESLPLKTCADASTTEHVIIVEAAEEFSSSYENFCYHLKGPDAEMAKAIDVIGFKALGIN